MEAITKTAAYCVGAIAGTTLFYLLDALIKKVMESLRWFFSSAHQSSAKPIQNVRIIKL